MIIPLIPSDPVGLSLYTSARKPTLNIESDSSVGAETSWALVNGACFEEDLEGAPFLASCLIALFAAFFASLLAAAFEIFGSLGRSGRAAVDSALVAGGTVELTRGFVILGEF